jgi:hypothetical protein
LCVIRTYFLYNVNVIRKLDYNDFYSEDALIETPTLALLKDLGWENANCLNGSFGAEGTLGRKTSSEVVLLSRLRPALERFNPELPLHTINLAIDELFLYNFRNRREPGVKAI